MLSNAIKFTKRGSVDIEMVGLPLPADPDVSPTAQPRFEIRCKVKDTGLGISPAQLATLFKSFSQSVGRPVWLGLEWDARPLISSCVLMELICLCCLRLFALHVCRCRVQHASGEYGGTGQSQQRWRMGTPGHAFALPSFVPSLTVTLILPSFNLSFLSAPLRFGPSHQQEAH